jgi:DNA-binding IclR family transcriptional regulator
LRAVAAEPRSLADLQQATDLPRATAHRLAVALERHGLLRRDGDGRFDLGPELAAMGRTAAERYPLAALARPVLERLRDASGESVQLFVRDGAQRRCVLSLQSPHALRWIVPEGVLFPLDAGSAGKAVITTKDSGELARILEDGVDGCVVDPDPAAIAHAMNEIHGNRKRARQLGVRLSEKLRSMLPSWESVATELTK